MKKIFFLLCIVLISIFTFAQNRQQGTVTECTIAEINISAITTVHLLSPEAIKYVDISTADMEGDLPEKNILRLKAKTGNNFKNGDSFIATVVTASFVAAYKFVFSEQQLTTSHIITIDPSQAIQLNDPVHLLSEKDYRRLALHALSSKRSIYNITSKAYDIKFWVNNIFIAGDLVLLDIGSSNKSKIPFTIDELRFKLTDAKQTKAHISQDIELKPLYQLYAPDENNSIISNWRNFYIFKKFTYPTQKVLNIEMTETQISGRTTNLTIDYNQVLNANFLNE